MNKILFDTRKPNGLNHFKEQLDTLIKNNADPEEEYYNDIHIYQEDSFIVLEWDHVPYDHSFGGRFVLVDEDQVVMTEKVFTDNHTELCYDEDDFQERLKEWLEENPGWVKTFYGTWTNEIENQKYREQLQALEEKKIEN